MTRASFFIESNNMNVKSLLNIENTRELLRKLVKFVKNPLKFFQENKDTEEQLLDFMTLIIRLSAVISALFNLALAREPIRVLIIVFLVTVLLARVVAVIYLFIFPRILNFFVSIITRKDDLLAAKRIFAYSSPVSLIHPIPIIGFLTPFLTITLYTIGISKQYNLSFPKSFLIAVLPLIILGMLAYFLLGAQETLNIFF